MRNKTILTTLFIIPLFFFGSSALADSTNSGTGANSTNNSSVQVKNKLEVSNSNSFNANNNVTLSLTTGGNQASSNTGSGSIDTGNISASVSITNESNMPSAPSSGTDGNGGSGGNGGGTNPPTGGGKSSVTVTTNGVTQGISAALGPDGQLEFSFMGGGNSEEALVLAANTGNVLGSEEGGLGDPLTATGSESLISFFLKYILPLIIIALVITMSVWRYVRGKTKFQT